MGKKLLSFVCILSMLMVWAHGADVYAAPYQPESKPGTGPGGEWVTEGLAGIRVDNADEALTLLTGGASQGLRGLGLSAPSPEYQLMDTSMKPAGQGKTYPFQQTYRGIPFYGMVRIVNTDEKGYVQAICGDDDTVAAGMALQTDPVLTEQAAIDAAVVSLGLREPVFNSTEAELCYCMKLIPGDENLYHLAYRIVMSGLDPIQGFFYWAVMVDAVDGHILRKTSQRTAHYTGARGRGVLGDIKGFPVLLDTSGYYYMYDRDKKLYCYDMKNGYVHESASWSRDSNGEWYNERQAAEVDAYYYMHRVYDYFMDTFGLKSYDGKGATIKVYAHYGVNEVNACWDGKGFCFGDGDGIVCLPLSGAPDVVAHEYTHAITESFAGLEYYSLSGALDEAFSDVFGAFVDNAVSVKLYNTELDDTRFYRCAECIWLSGPALRDMANPKLYNMPAHMKQYRHMGAEDEGGVHVNCAIPCKAFHAMGQSLSREQLAYIWFTALTGYLTPYSDFWDARAATAQVAENLYGSAAAASIEAAWDSVGVTAAHPDAHGNTLDQATPYLFGSTVSGSINWAGDVDCFSFTPTSGGTYDFYTTGKTDTIGGIADATGEVLAADNDSGDGLNFRFSIALQKNKTYYLIIRHRDDYGHGDYTLRSSGVINPVTSLSVTISPSASCEIKTPVTIRASAGPEAAEYQFQVKKHAASRWTVLQPYQQNAVVQWIPQEPGIYDIRVCARSVGRTSAYDLERQYGYEVTDIPALSGVTLGTQTAPLYENKVPVTFTATPLGDPGETSRAEYLFHVKQGKKKVFTRDWDTDRNCTWTPAAVGAYTVEVQARTRGRTSVDAKDELQIDIAYPPALSGLSLSAPEGPFERGTPIVLTAVAEGEQRHRTEYQFRVLQGKKWTVLRPWSSVADYEWTPTKIGSYTVEIQARTYGRVTTDQTVTRGYTIEDIFKLTSVSLSGSPEGLQQANQSITLTARAEGVHAAAAQYAFQYSTDGKKWHTITSGFTDKNSATLTPTKDAVYRFRVQARSPGRTGVDTEAVISQRFYIGAMPVEDVSLDVSPETIQETGKPVRLSAVATGEAAGNALYRFQVKLGNRWTVIQDWSTASTVDWRPEKAGAYTIEVQAKAAGRAAADASASTAYSVVDVFPLTGVSLEGPPGMREAGIPITLTADATGPHADTAEYAFQYSTDGKKWTKITSGFSRSHTVTYTPVKDAVYRFRVQARSAGRTGVDQEAILTRRVYIGPMPLEDVTLRADRQSPQETGDCVVLTAEAQGAQSVIPQAEYCFRVKLGKKWTTLQAWSLNPIYLWEPAKTGKYDIEVQTRTKGRTTIDATHSINGYEITLPPKLTGVELSASVDSPQEARRTITLAATAKGAETETSRAEYLFRVKLGKKWTTLQNWSADSTCDWAPEKTGKYTVEVQARTKGRTTIDATHSINGYEITLPPKLTGVELSVSVDSPQEARRTITLAATAKGAETETSRAEYLFRVKLGKKWTILQNWNANSTCDWVPEKAGVYTIEVQARTKGRTTTDATQTIKEYEIILPPKLTGVEISVNADSPQEAGRTTILTATAEGAQTETSRAEYLFRVKLGKKWTILQNWSADSTCDWIPEKAGVYTIEVQARTKGRTTTDAVQSITGYEITLPPKLAGVAVSASADSPQEAGRTITLTATAKGPETETSRAEYLFRVKLGKKWTTLQNWNADSTCDWVPEKTGKYTIEVQARTKGRTTIDATQTIKEYEIILPPKLAGIEVSANIDSPQEAGRTITLTATAEGAETETSRAEYLFRMKLDKKWTTLQNWSTDSTCDWVPEKTGAYTIEVQARTKGRNTADASRSIPYTITDIIPVSAVALSAQPQTYGVKDVPTTITAMADRPFAEYRFMVRRGDAAYTLLRDWDSEAGFMWTPSEEGQYTLLVLSRARRQTAVQATRTLPYRVLAVHPVTDVVAEADPQGGQELGNTVEITARADQPGAEYQFAYSLDGEEYTVVKDFSTDASFTWEPAATGIYTWRVRARTDSTFPQGQAEGLMEYPIYTVVEIPDSALRAGLANALGKEPGEVITSLDMVSLRVLDCSGLGVENLAGIESAVNLIDIDLSNNRIADINPLQTLVANGGLHGADSRLDITLNGLDMREGTYIRAMVDAFAAAGITVAYLPQHPIVGSVDLGTDAESPGDAGMAVQISASADQPGVEYRFLVGDTALTDWTDADTVSWVPDTAGVYTITVQARTWGMPGTEVTASLSYEVIPPPLTTVDLETDHDSPIEKGGTVTLSATGEAGAWYRFQAMREGEAWETIRDWEQSGVAEWTPSQTGHYILRVQARRDGRPDDRVDSSDTEEYRVIPVALSGDLVLDISPESPQNTGTPITISVNDLGPGVEYRFGVRTAEEDWVWIGEWDTQTSAFWTPYIPGTYTVCAQARAAGRDGYDLEDTAEFTSSLPPVGAVTLSIDPGSPQPAGTAVTLTADSEAGDPEYCFSVKAEEGEYITIQEWSGSDTCTWVPEAAGSYTLRVQVREAGQTIASAEYTCGFLVTWPSLTALTLGIDSESPYQLQSRLLTATADTEHAEFRFSVQNPGESWDILQDWSAEDTCQWHPSAAGEYVLQVEGRGIGRSGADLVDTMAVTVRPSPPLYEWTAFYGGSGEDESFAVKQTSDGGYILSGCTRSSDVPGYRGTSGNSDAYLVKTDSAGNVQWQFCTGGTNNDTFYDVIEVEDGGYLAVGGSMVDAYLYVSIVKVSASGDIQWKKTYGGVGHSCAYTVIRTRDGNYCIAGKAGDEGFSGLTPFKFPSTKTDGFIMKINKNGQPLWLQYYGGNGDEIFHDIIESSEGSLVCVGETSSSNLNNSFHGSIDGWMVKVNSSGTLQWQRAIGGSMRDYLYSVCQRLVGDTMQYDAVGYTHSNDGDISGNRGNGDGFLASISASGTALYSMCLGGSGSDRFQYVMPVVQGGLVILGSTDSMDGSLSDTFGNGRGWIIRLDGQNQILWQKKMHEYNRDAVACQTHDGGFALTGYHNNMNKAYGPLEIGNFLLTKLSPEGMTEPFFSGMTIDSQNPPGIGAPVVIHGISNLEEVEYRILCYDSSGVETLLLDWGMEDSVVWTPEAVGTHVIKMQARMPGYPQYIETDIVKLIIK